MTQPTRDTNGTDQVRYTTDTTPVTGNFSQIMTLAPTQFSALARTGATGSITSLTLPAGILLIGPFTGYTLSSGGAVAAYS